MQKAYARREERATQQLQKHARILPYAPLRFARPNNLTLIFVFFVYFVVIPLKEYGFDRGPSPFKRRIDTARAHPLFFFGNGFCHPDLWENRTAAR